jgi:hypothetical protein
MGYVYCVVAGVDGIRGVDGIHVLCCSRGRWDTCTVL